jgi:hypothetical protein
MKVIPQADLLAICSSDFDPVKQREEIITRAAQAISKEVASNE